MEQALVAVADDDDGRTDGRSVVRLARWRWFGVPMPTTGGLPSQSIPAAPFDGGRFQAVLARTRTASGRVMPSGGFNGGGGLLSRSLPRNPFTRSP